MSEFKGQVVNCVIQLHGVEKGTSLFREDAEGKGYLLANLDGYLIRPRVPADVRCYGWGLGGLWWHMVAGYQSWKRMRGTKWWWGALDRHGHPISEDK